MKNYDNTQQPFHQVIDDLLTSFESSYGINAFKENGFRTIIQSDSYKEKYMGKLLNEVSEESERALVSQMIENSMKSLDDPFGLEAFDGGFQSGTNRQEMYALAPITVLGYTARSHSLELFNVISKNDPEFSMKYNIDYVIPGDATSFTSAKSLPAAIRDGSIAGMLDGQKVAPAVSGDHPHVQAGGYIEAGASGNFILETPDKDIRKWTLGGNLAIDGVKVDNDHTDAAPAIIDVAVYAKASPHAGDMAKRVIIVTAVCKLTDDSDYSETLTLVVNRDTGEYVCTPGARIKSFHVDMDLVNAANEVAPLSAGRKEYLHYFHTKERKPMSIPLTEGGLVSDYSEGGKKLGMAGYIKKMTDILTTGFAGINDVDLEKYLKDRIDAAVTTPTAVETYPLAQKLGGYVANQAFDVADRGPGGDNPSSWFEYGIKDLVRSLITDAEAEVEIESYTPKAWTILGYANDIERFVENRYKSGEGAAPAVKNGFALEGTFNYSDNFGRRVALIGSREKRHKNWAGQVIGTLKTTDLSQPTNVYFGYDFKVAKGVDPTVRNIPSIMFYARDYWETLALVGFRIDLTNPTNLNAAIATKVNA